MTFVVSTFTSSPLALTAVALATSGVSVANGLPAGLPVGLPVGLAVGLGSANATGILTNTNNIATNTASSILKLNFFILFSLFFKKSYFFSKLVTNASKIYTSFPYFTS